MAAHSAGPLLMLTATPSESHPHLTGRDVTNEWETDRNLMLGCVSLAAHTLVCVRPWFACLFPKENMTMGDSDHVSVY